MKKLLALALLAELLAACNGAGATSVNSLPAFADRAKARVHAILRIAIPRKVRRAGRHPNFISPATKSMTIAITPNGGGDPLNITANLTPTSSGCNSTLTTTVCVVQLALAPGSYTANIATYSGTDATGATLSEGQNEPISVAPGTSNQVNLTLYGVPASLVIVPTSPGTSGSQFVGFTTFGSSGVARFTIVAQDANQNPIVGPGSPQFKVSSTDGTFAISPPTATQPNQLAVTPPVVTGTAQTQITATASYADPSVCVQSQAACKLTFNFGVVSFAGDDWTTFAHDPQRTGYQSQNTGITTQTVHSLQLAWTARVAGTISASLLVSRGLVIVATQSLNVYAFNAQSGAIVWRTKVPLALPYGANSGLMKATPSLDGRTLFVGTMYVNNTLPWPAGNVAVPTFPGDVYAIDLLTGSILWTTHMNAAVRGPLLAMGGRLYVGTAGGDALSCLQGGISALDEATGQILWSWTVSPVPNNGGSVWSPVTFDGQHLVAGTGNTCTVPEPTADGVVALNLDGTVAWTFEAPDNVNNSDEENGGHNSDQGGGVMFSGSQYYMENKDGNAYGVDASGHLLSTTTMGGFGSHVTPTTDGTTIIFDAGLIQSAAAVRDRKARDAETWIMPGSDGRPNWSTPHGLVPLAGTSHSNLMALDTAGNLRWSVPSSIAISAYSAINGGVVFAPIDNTLTALDISSGSVLWKYSNASDGHFWPGAAVVPSGVYTADSYGYVYAFRLSAPSAAPHRRAASFRKT